MIPNNPKQSLMKKNEVWWRRVEAVWLAECFLPEWEWTNELSSTNLEHRAKADLPPWISRQSGMRVWICEFDPSPVTGRDRMRGRAGFDTLAASIWVTAGHGQNGMEEKRRFHCSGSKHSWPTSMGQPVLGFSKWWPTLGGLGIGVWYFFLFWFAAPSTFGPLLCQRVRGRGVNTLACCVTNRKTGYSGTAREREVLAPRQRKQGVILDRGSFVCVLRCHCLGAYTENRCIDNYREC